MFIELAKTILIKLTAAFCIIGSVTLGQPVLAETAKVDNGLFARMLNLPVYQWQDNQQTPRAVVLAIHGLTMHGTVFDACARKLAADGAIVIALDLRGYGAWYKSSKNTHVNYEQSENDLCSLANAVQQKYKGLPVFLAGESLGGSMAIRIAAKHAELIDGLILCAPAIKLRYSPRALVKATFALAHRNHQLDVSDYIKRNFSEDSQITEEGLSDPLIRKQLSMSDMLDSCLFIAATRHYISKIPSRIPVLVLQGEKDRIVKPSGVTVLQSSLKTTDETVQLLPLQGHILIETQHIHPVIMKTIISWMNSECTMYTLKHARIAADTSVYQHNNRIPVASTSQYITPLVMAKVP